jgi:transcription-repair coupling factor (superfamily II helicase)
MARFLAKEVDVLVSTTIIESGLDIPSANTMVIDRADRFGLAELHQLRGRVGRGTHKAYCYLLLPDDKPVKPEARHRLQAIEEFTELGSGFQIAMRDLEIRGAGNILGKEQSGHIASVGYDLFCRLLERAIAEIRGTPWREPPDIEIGLAATTRIPEEYIPDVRQRLRAYRSIATALAAGEVDEIAADLADRFGKVPAETEELLRLQKLRILLGGWGVRRIDAEDGWLILEGDAEAIPRAMQGRGWQVVALPEGQFGARPPRGKVTAELTAVLALLGV